jgi:hypothetical protein
MSTLSKELPPLTHSTDTPCTSQARFSLVLLGSSRVGSSVKVCLPEPAPSGSDDLGLDMRCLSFIEMIVPRDPCLRRIKQ